MVVSLAVTSRVLDPSVATAGMGLLFFLYAIPVLSLARGLGRGQPWPL